MLNLGLAVTFYGGEFMEIMVDVKDINKDFYTLEGELNVLKNINFSVEKGEILAILGPSGCGKSTLLNILSGLLKPNFGEVYIKGKIVICFKEIIF